MPRRQPLPGVEVTLNDRPFQDPGELLVQGAAAVELIFRKQHSGSIRRTQTGTFQYQYGAVPYHTDRAERREVD